jgi:hypothetical protein
MSGLAGLVMLVITPRQVVPQVQRSGPPPASVVVLRHVSSVPSRSALPAFTSWGYQSRADRSAAGIIATHALVGTGAGLAIGLALSGASVGDDRTTVVVTWTALGAAAGIVSGVVTWLVGRRH